jgi:flagellar motor component MotA
MTELTSEGVTLLDSLFFNPYTNMISYGIMSNIISALMENDNEEIEEDDDEDGEEFSITVSSEWGIL